jgi:hypothetical protein
MRDKKDKENEPIYTAGFYDADRIVVFEQVLGQQYAISASAYPDAKEPQIDVDYSQGDKKILPYTYELPWPLVEKPLPYLNKNALYEQIRTFIKNYFYTPDERVYDVQAAWVMATYIHEKIDMAPILFFYGAKSTGKTRGLEVLSRICYRGLLTPNTSPAALFRCVADWKVTLFLDETEILAGKQSDSKSEIIGLLNSGYKRGQMAIRAEPTDEGFLPKAYNVFRLKAVAGTQGLKDTLESRCIFIKTSKNPPGSISFRINEREAEVLRAQLLQYRFNQLTCDACDGRDGFDGNTGEVAEPSQPLLKGVTDGRLQELAEPLLMVANDGSEAITEFMKDFDKERNQETLSSLDTEVLEAVVNISVDRYLPTDSTKQKFMFLTADIENAVNADKPQQDKIERQVIGRIIRKFGFCKWHIRQANGFLRDDDKVRRLCDAYSLDLPSHLSQPSQPSQEGLKDHE